MTKNELGFVFCCQLFDVR